MFGCRMQAFAIIIHAQNYNEIGGKSAYQPMCLHTLAVIYLILDFWRKTNEFKTLALANNIVGNID